MISSKRFVLDRSNMLSFLDELQKAGGRASTLYIPPGSFEPGLIEKIVEFSPALPGITTTVSTSKTGSILFWGEQKKYLVIPPMPVSEKGFFTGYKVEPLLAFLKQDFIIALVLIRLGSYAIGLARGDRLISGKVGTGLVHARHRQGGSSQHRFERHRDKQIETFLTRVCGHAREQLQAYASEIDYIVYGGAWTTILLLKKQCPFLQQFEDVSLPSLLTIPEPRQAELELAVVRVWSSTITQYD